MAGLLVVVSAALFVVSRLIGSPSVGTVTVAVAHLEPSAGDAMASLPTMRAISGGNDSSQTILIEGKTEAIVGQLARIPSENSSISDIKTVSEVDNRTGRELLSIISKY
jgi:hypothetical protein